MPYIVATYYSDGTEQVQSCRDEESAQVDYLLQLDAMKSTPGVIERVQIATVIKDSDIPHDERILTMNTAKHTPGPWIYDGGSSIKSPSTDIEVVSLYGAMGGDNNKADAYMLSAAPAMYEALQAMVIANHGLPINPMDEKDEICRRALEKAQKALAQAEGK